MPQEGKSRLDPRIAVRFRVDVEYPPRAGGWKSGVTIDLSASGAYLTYDGSLPLKAQVGCRLYLPAVQGEDDRVIDCQAVVLRVDAPAAGVKEWRYGVYFLGLTEADMQAVRRYVFAQI